MSKSDNNTTPNIPEEWYADNGRCMASSSNGS